MKKDVLKNIEEIKVHKKLPEEIEKRVKKRIIANWVICISIMTLILVLSWASRYLPQNSVILIYKICSILFLLFTLIVFEIAYKKDSGKWAICGIELLALSTFILFSPYIFLKARTNLVYGAISVTSIYYIIKIIEIYYYERKNYISENNDIPNIIKKESQDERAKEEQKKMLKNLKKKQNEKLKKNSSKKSAKTNNKTSVSTKKTNTKKSTASKTRQKTRTKKDVKPKKENKENK